MYTFVKNQVINVLNPVKLFIRTRYHADKVARGRLVRRNGYEEKIFLGGLLPRHKDFQKIEQLPIYRPKNAWNEKRSLFGQNDYIDILGNSDIHPTQMLYNLPSWVRGINGNQLHMMIKKRNAMIRTKMPITRPTKWRDLQKMIHFLYKRYNRHTKTGFSKNN